MSWLLRRLLTSAALIWVVASIVFLAIRLVPGDPAELLLSFANESGPSASQSGWADERFARPLQCV